MSVVSPQDRLAGAWNFSAVHSAISFSVPYVVASFRASFEEVAATLIDDKLSGAAKVASVDVKDENLAAHLMSAEFFDADNHPEITFTSDELKIDGDNVQLEGELTIKGITNALHATGTVEGPPRTPRATRGWASPSRPRSTARRTASAGTQTCRAAAARCPTTSS